MEKRISVVALLVLVLIPATAFAQSSANNRELCLAAQSSNPAVTTQSTHVLSYTGLTAGHVLFYGETCYVVPANPPLPEVKDCLPVSGSGILNEGKLEFSMQGAEYNSESGFGVFTSGIFHVLLSLDTLTGTYATESVNYYQLESGPLKQEFFDTGNVTAVKCPEVSQSEREADILFQKLIRQLDAL